MNELSGTPVSAPCYYVVSHDSPGSVRFRRSIVWVLPEETRVRRAVGEGVGRGLRDTYQTSESIPAGLGELLGRIEQREREKSTGRFDGLAEAA